MNVAKKTAKLFAVPALAEGQIVRVFGKGVRSAFSKVKPEALQA